MFLSRKALIEKNGHLQHELDMLRKQLAELEEKQRNVPENCTPGEWCKACENAYVEYSSSPFGSFKVATCTLDRCPEFSKPKSHVNYLSSLLQFPTNGEETEK